MITLVIECPAPETVNHSSLATVKSKYVYMDTLVYTCDTGYEMLTGNATRTCTETTDWTGIAPACTSKCVLYHKSYSKTPVNWTP